MSQGDRHPRARPGPGRSWLALPPLLTVLLAALALWLADESQPNEGPGGGRGDAELAGQAAPAPTPAPTKAAPAAATMLVPPASDGAATGRLAPTAEPAVALRSETRPLLGRVTDVDGRPVADAGLRLSGVADQRRWRLVTTSDVDGRFSVPGVPAGRVQLDASARGFAAHRSVGLVHGAGAIEHLVVLSSAAVLDVQLVDGSGVACAGEVTAEHLAPPAGWGSIRSRITATRDGHARLDGLNAGPWSVSALGSRLIVDLAPGEVGLVRLGPPLELTLAGRVVCAGRPVPDVVVAVGSDRPEQARTDDRTRGSARSLRPAIEDGVASSARSGSDEPRQATRVLWQATSTDEDGRFRLAVPDSATGVRVAVVPFAEVGAAGTLHGQPNAIVLPATEGRDERRLQPWPTRRLAEQDVAPPVDGLELTLALGSLTVRVMHPDGEVVAERLVTLRGADSGEPLVTRPTDDDGRVDLERIPAGSYDVLAAAPTTEGGHKAWHRSALPEAVTGAVVSSDAHHEVELVVPRFATLRVGVAGAASDGTTRLSCRPASVEGLGPFEGVPRDLSLHDEQATIALPSGSWILEVRHGDRGLVARSEVTLAAGERRELALDVAGDP